jgi:hypothetical protein
MLATALVLTVFSMPLGMRTTRLAAQEVGEWSVVPDPETSIGVVDGDARRQFTTIRAGRILRDGRIVVADRGSSTIRVFGSDGGFLTEMGGEGDGPGEFRLISGMWITAPDTLHIWDSSAMRLTTFVADGSLVGTERFAASQPAGPGGSLDGLAGLFSDGGPALSWTVPGPRIGGGVAPDRTVFGRFNSDGTLQHFLGEGEGLHRHAGSPDPFSPYPHATVYRDSLYFMNGVGGRIAVFSPDGGGVARTIDVPAPHMPVDEAWTAFRETVLAEGRESLLRRVPAPKLEHTPSLAGLLIDDQGRLWVKLYDPKSDSVYFGRPPGVGGEWWVLTPVGQILARVAMPARVVPLQITGDRLLGISVDALDVQRTVVHILQR